MNKWELFLLQFAGRVIEYLAVLGFALTVWVDDVRGRPFELGWLQITGLMCFMGLFLFGNQVSIFLRTVSRLLEDYLNH